MRGMKNLGCLYMSRKKSWMPVLGALLLLGLIALAVWAATKFVAQKNAEVAAAKAAAGPSEIVAVQDNPEYVDPYWAYGYPWWGWGGKRHKKKKKHHHHS